MAETASALETLGTHLCPWLAGPLAQLERAHAEGRLAHAWLIKGPQGVGKINLALVLAHRLAHAAAPGNALSPACLDAARAGTAMATRHALVDHDPDLHWLYPPEGKKTISIDAIREVIAALGLKGFRGRNKVVIIEPAEAMTGAAANALLKTLEQPTARTYLLLVSHQPERLLPTIRSRCQTLTIACPDTAQTVAWLGVDAAEVRDALLACRGAPLRALELLTENNRQYLKEIPEQLEAISRFRMDPQELAEAWSKRGAELPLEWLAHRLQLAIRRRLGGEDFITEATNDELHNAWQGLSCAQLFNLLKSTEQLADRLGKGLNTELVLKVLLLQFQISRVQH